MDLPRIVLPVAAPPRCARPAAAPGRWPPRPLAILALGLSSGCGAGVAAVVASSEDSGGGIPPAISAFTVVNPKEPAHARVSFRLSKRAAAELFYQIPGGPPRSMSQAGPNPRQLEAGPQAIPWNFGAEPGLSASFMDRVLVFACLSGIVDEPREGENALTLGLGNDPPAIVVEDPASMVDGVVPILVSVSDTSGDAVSLRVEFEVEGEPLGWRGARPGGLHPGDPTPDLAMQGIVAPRDGAALVFFWDTGFDLSHLERRVRLRLTPLDPVVAGAPAESALFRVDNNAEPIAFVQEGPLAINPDQRRGIPVPYEVVDEEGDPVRLLFQWRRQGEDFPELPDLSGDPERGAELLADPELRRQYHVCTQAPALVQGWTTPVGPEQVRLAELGGPAAQLLSGGLEGRTLEVLRSSSEPAPMASTWSENRLRGPVVALPIGDGLGALVLDAPSLGSWRLHEVELASGAIVRELATGTGEPTALALERGGDSVLVAAYLSGDWRVDRVALGANPGVQAPVPLLRYDGTTEAGAIRGIASLGTSAALITVGSSLVRLDWADPLAPTARTFFDDLAGPWGVVLDPHHRSRVWVAEHEAATAEGIGRLLSIDLATRERRALAGRSPDHPDEPAFPGPRSIAVERAGGRLLVVCDVDPGAGRHELRALDLGGTGANTTYPIATLPPTAAAVATGPDGLRLVAVPGADDLLVGGGLLARRTIAGYEPASQLVRLSEPFVPELTGRQPWRITPAARSAASPGGARGVFLWDSEDVHGGDVFLRATPLDSGVGIASETSTRRRIRWEEEPLDLPVGVWQTCVAVADLDGDGDLDVVSANGADPALGGSADTLMIFFRASPADFGPTPVVLGGRGLTNDPQSVGVADLDGDSDLDIVSANLRGDTLTVFFQRADRTFDSQPSLVLGDPTHTDGPHSVAVADVDGDGDTDLASANYFSDTLTVFLQSSPGTFGPAPSVMLGSSQVTGGARAVTAADLDGDRDFDLASANQLSGNVTVFFQSSPGSFDPTPLELDRSSGSPQDVEAADLDGDGDLDLVSANTTSTLSRGALTVFCQRTPGVFDAAPQVLEHLTATRGSNSVRAADLDADGDLDLVSSNGFISGGQSVTVFFQLSPGVFDPIPLVLGGPGVLGSPHAVEAADVDADGDLDLVAANAGGLALTVFLQSSPGVFLTAPVELGDFTMSQATRGVAAGDLDGDGDLDLVSANFYGLALTLFHQTSPGAFDSAPLQLGHSQAGAASSVSAADLDGDGDLDLASANARTVSIFYQRSPGTIDPVPLLLGNPRSFPDWVRSIAASDLDGDSDLDLVAANSGSGGRGTTLWVFFQSSPGDFDPTPSLVLGESGKTDNPYSVAAADLDGDGDQDIVSANWFNDSLTVFFQSSPGSFDPTPSLVLGSPATTDAPLWVTASDIDGDGDQDLVSANLISNTLTIFPQSGSGAFDPWPSLALGRDAVLDGPSAVAAADLDADGDLDLVSANGTSQTLTAFFASRPGVFDAAPRELVVLDRYARPEAVITADVDGDGDLDIAFPTDHELWILMGGR